MLAAQVAKRALREFGEGHRREMVWTLGNSLDLEAPPGELGNFLVIGLFVRSFDRW